MDVTTIQKEAITRVVCEQTQCMQTVQLMFFLKLQSYVWLYFRYKRIMNDRLLETDNWCFDSDNVTVT